MINIELKKQDLIERLKKHDYDTLNHSERVAKMSYEFGAFLGYEDKELKLLRDAAQFHDIGKLHIDSSILTKKERLKEEEFAEILKHTIHSEEILKKLGFPVEILKAVRGHHENYDGSGYPDGVKHEEISNFAAIIRIVDSYDAIVNNRPYSAAEEKEKALCEILSLKGKFYNPYLAEKFNEYMSNTKTSEH